MLAACGGPQLVKLGPGTSSLPAPSGLVVEAGDGSATLSWEAVADPRVAGYNVYQDGKRVNSAPIAGLATASLTRLSYHVTGLTDGHTYGFAVTTLEQGGKESVLPKAIKLVPIASAAEIMVNPLTPASALPNQLPAGDQREIFFEVQKPGKIIMDASFSGTELALILNGPGQLGYYARVDGPGPLHLEYNVTNTELLKGTAWRASLVNFSSKPASDVQLDIDRPLVTGPGTNINATTIVNPSTPVGATPNSLPADGTRELFFEVQRPGLIKVKADFSGPNLALILNGPRQLGYYARVDGSGPLTLSYNVTAADLAKGTAWRLRLKNFSNTPAQNVQITLEHPNVASLTPAATVGQILTNPLTPVGATPNSLPAGDRREVFFEVRRPGRIKVDAGFSGPNLALILNGPGQLGYYARVDGSGPLTLNYNVTAADVQKGTEWRLSLVNFSANDAQNVLIDIRYPTLIQGGNGNKKPGTSWGDPHLISFDGLKYGFQPVGEFILIESAIDPFEVQVRQEPWNGSSKVSVNTAVATLVGGHRVGLYVKQGQPLMIDGVSTPLADGASVALGGGSLKRSGNSYQFDYPTGDELTATLNGSKYMNLTIKLPAAQQGAVAGLLGNADGNTADDIAMRGGPVIPQPVPYAVLVGSYADSWRISNAESLFDYAPGEDTNTFTDPNFPNSMADSGDLDPAAASAAKATCQAAGVVNPIVLEACILDVVLTGDSSFAQSAAAAQQPVKELELALPDLVIVQADIDLADSCQPYHTILLVTAEVRNYGNAASPAQPSVGMVGALDAAGSGWGNGTGLPALAPGASHTVTFPIYYLISDPAYMEGYHEFTAEVNRGGWIAEADTGNNTFVPNLAVRIPEGYCREDFPAKVAILHGADASAAVPYKAGLEANGLFVDLIALGSAAASDPAVLDDYQVLIIDTFSGYLDSWEGSDKVLEVIAKTRRPVIAVGEGGYVYLGRIGSPLGWPNGWHGNDFTGFETTTPLHPALLGPRAVALTAGRVVVSSSKMDYVSIHLPHPGAGIELVGREDGDATHYPVVVDRTRRNAIWGAHGVPSSYTADGWDALANLVNYMTTLP